MGCEAARKRVAILISGRGSNMTALIHAAASPYYPAVIALVLSNKADAQGLTRAAAAGIKTAVVDHKRFSSRESFDAAVNDQLIAENIDLVCLAGFMRIQSAGFVAHWSGRLLNIHPSRLPAFKGLHPQQQAIDAGVVESGCTVHFVTAELDSGPIIAQASVPVLAGDTAETLEARILAAEHSLYPQALARVALGEVRFGPGAGVGISPSG